MYPISGLSRHLWRKREKAVRYQATIWDALSYHFVALLGSLGFVDPRGLMPVIVGDLAKTDGSRDEVRYATNMCAPAENEVVSTEDGYRGALSHLMKASSNG
jgi:hypothetical protein